MVRALLSILCTMPALCASLCCLVVYGWQWQTKNSATARSFWYFWSTLWMRSFHRRALHRACVSIWQSITFQLSRNAFIERRYTCDRHNVRLYWWNLKRVKQPKLFPLALFVCANCQSNFDSPICNFISIHLFLFVFNQSLVLAEFGDAFQVWLVLSTRKETKNKI